MECPNTKSHRPKPHNVGSTKMRRDGTETRMRFIAILITLIIVFAPTGGMAAGFQIFEAGAGAMGMAGAMAARANDPSAIFYNPAGLGYLNGTHLYLGASFIFTETQFAGVDPDPGFGTSGQTGTLFFTPLNAYFTHSVSPRFTFGIGVFNPFGLGQDYDNPESFIGRHIADDTDLVTFYINPTVAWKPIEKLSFGLGIQLVYATVTLHRFLEQWNPNGGGFVNVGQLELSGNNTLDAGVNAGLIYRPNDRYQFGVQYRSQVTTTIEGDADFSPVSTGDPALDAVVAQGIPPDQDVRTQIKLPWIFTVAGAYTGIEHWVFEADLVVNGWEVFDELRFEFADPSLNVTRPQDYETKLSLRTGLGFDLTDTVTLRAGYYYDPTPQPKKTMSPFLGDADRHGITAGIGYARGRYTIDAFWLTILTDPRETAAQSLDDFNGTYSTWGHLFGVNLGREF